MKKIWESWLQEAVDHMDVHYGRIDMTRTERFEREAWRSWACGENAFDFVSRFIRESIREK